jgi:TRAP-type C4-dicarboxylate transport system permease small subunit
MIVRGVVAGAVLVVLVIAGWLLAFRAIEREVDNRYGTYIP